MHRHAPEHRLARTGTRLGFLVLLAMFADGCNGCVTHTPEKRAPLPYPAPLPTSPPAPAAAPTHASTPAPAPASASDSKLPEFPWPPPRPSTRAEIPDRFLRARAGVTSLAQVADHLWKTLDRRGYDDLSWYAIPGGFALVTRLEQIDSKGRPIGKYRWSDEPHPSFELGEIFRFLLAVPEGTYRIVAFIATNQNFDTKAPPPSEREANAWLNGPIKLSPAIRRQLYTDEHHTYVLIYQFRKRRRETARSIPSTLSAVNHLQAAGIWEGLSRP